MICNDTRKGLRWRQAKKAVENKVSIIERCSSMLMNKTNLKTLLLIRKFGIIDDQNC